MIDMNWFRLILFIRILTVQCYEGKQHQIYYYNWLRIILTQSSSSPSSSSSSWTAAAAAATITTK